MNVFSDAGYGNQIASYSLGQDTTITGGTKGYYQEVGCTYPYWNRYNMSSFDFGNLTVSGTIPLPFYTQIQNISSLDLYDASSTASTVLKTLPVGWVIQVETMKDASGSPMIDASGNMWFEVNDPAHSLAGWMMASSTTNTYLAPYNTDVQSSLAADATVTTFPSPLQQYYPDGVTVINNGALATTDSVMLEAGIISDASTTVQLQVEVKPTGSNFTGTPNVTSTFVSPGTNATTTFAGSAGSYHWQARTFNGTDYSPWQSFGSSSASTDFAINPPAVAMTTRTTLTGSASIGYTLTVTITNSGAASIPNVQLIAASLGSATGSPLPQSLGTIVVGESATTTVSFPGTIGNDGASVREIYSGTYTGGSFSYSLRAVTLP